MLPFLILGCSWESKHANRVVLKVNEESLEAKEFASLLANKLKVYDALTVKDESVLLRIKRSVTNDFIIQKITADYARRNGILVRKEDMEAEINSIRSHYPDDLAFRKSLADQNLTFEDWTDRLRKSLVQKLVLRKLKEDLEEPTEEELKTFYDSNQELFSVPEKVHLIQVVLKTENDAKQIQDELKKKRPLGELAREYSIAPESDASGDLGWVEKGTLEVFDKAFSMRVGQQSPILKSPYGYHIFEVKGKRPEHTRKFEEAKDMILRRIMEKKEQASYSQWLEFEMKNAKIFKDEALIEAIQVETKK